MIKFPEYTDWLLEQNIPNLRKDHEDGGPGAPASFDRYCKAEYDEAHEDWGARMGGNENIIYEIDEMADICDESAKLVLVQMINSCTEDGAVGEIICTEDMTPDHETARAVVNQFWGYLIPAFERFLKEWHS